MRRNPAISDELVASALATLGEVAEGRRPPDPATLFHSGEQRLAAAQTILGHAWVYEQPPIVALPDCDDEPTRPAPEAMNQPEAVLPWSFNDHGNAMLERIEELIRAIVDPLAGADLLRARAHVEDALTRYNSARYRMAGMWKRADSDEVIALAECRYVDRGKVELI